MNHPDITDAPRLELRQDGPQTDCDGQNILFCGATGTCYTGTGGFIGCCSTTNCAARTTCVEYNQLSTQDCELDYGGCVPCTNPALPSCVTLINPRESQHAIYCDAVGRTVITAYDNLVTTGSMAAAPSGVIASRPPSSTLTSTLTSSSDSSISSQTAPLPWQTTPAPVTKQVTSSPTTAAGAALPAGQGSGYNLSSKSSGSLSGGAIAGIVVGSVLASAAVLAVIIWCLRKSTRGKGNGTSFTSHLRMPPQMPLGGLSSPQFTARPPVEKNTDYLGSSTHPSEVEGSPVPSQPTTFASRSSSLWSRTPVSRTVSPELNVRHWTTSMFRDAPGAVASDAIAEMSHENIFAPMPPDRGSRMSVSPPNRVMNRPSLGFLSAEQAMADGYRDTQ